MGAELSQRGASDGDGCAAAAAAAAASFLAAKPFFGCRAVRCSAVAFSRSWCRAATAQLTRPAQLTHPAQLTRTWASGSFRSATSSWRARRWLSSAAALSCSRQLWRWRRRRASSRASLAAFLRAAAYQYPPRAAAVY
jgi:hypothetical protein